MNPIPFRRSKQCRSIPPGEIVQIKMVKVSPGMNFILTRINVDTLSEQAEQDLIYSLKAGNSILCKSGKFQTNNPEYPTESRLNNTEGSLYSEISSSDGSGSPDNFDFLSLSYPSLHSENTEIIFEVKNQSAVYTHTIFVGISGTFIGKR